MQLQHKETIEVEVEEPIPAHNKNWAFGINQIRKYKKYMFTVYGLSMAFNDLNVDFDERRPQDGLKAKNDLLASVFLAKNANCVKLFDADNKILTGTFAVDQVKKVVINYNNQFDVEFHPEDKIAKTPAVFTINNLHRDYMASEVVAARQAFLEQAKAAMLLAQTAKEAGWKSVDFGDTNDPLQRYLLKRACEMFDLDCSSEKVDPAAIPHNKVFDESKQSMKDVADTTLGFIREEILNSPAIPKEKEQDIQKAEESKPTPAINIPAAPVADNDEDPMLAKAREKVQRRPQFRVSREP